MTSFPHHQMITTTQFVGRQAEIAALDAMLTLVVAGIGQTRLIMGEAGIGKSRLIGEVRTMAHQRGFTIVQPVSRAIVRCLTHLGENSYGPV